jgi:hypothetical protein
MEGFFVNYFVISLTKFHELITNFNDPKILLTY